MLLNDNEFHAAATALDQRRPIFAKGIIERRSGVMRLFKSVHEFDVVDRLSLEELDRLFE